MKSAVYCLVFTKVPSLPVRKPEGFLRKFDPNHFDFDTQTFRALHHNLHFFRYMNLTSGVCLPKQCTVEDITRMLQEFYNHFETGLSVNVDLCETQIDKAPITTAEWISAIVLLTIVTLNILGCFAKPGSVLYVFNWAGNWKSLVKPKSPEDTIGCINGIKAVTIIFVVIAHFQLGYVFASFNRSFAISKMAVDPVYAIVYIAPYTVDSFFVLAGLVNSLYFFESKRLFSPLPYFLLRWLRFAPLLLWTMCIQFWVFSRHMQKYMGGPLWGYYKATGGIVDACERTWLSTLLLVQYWFDGPDDINFCFVFDWYLDVDYFFSALFLIVLIPYLKKMIHLALFNTFLMIFGGVLASGLILHLLDLQHTWVVTDYQEMDLYRYTWLFNLKPWAHITPYFIGVLLGFFLSRPKLNPSKPIIILCWLLCIVFFLIIMAHEIAVNAWSVILPYGLSLAYGMTSKSMWAASVAWIIFATHNGYFFNRVRKLLSAHLFVVLARVNLSLLCTHLVFVRLRTATYRTPQMPSYFDQFFYSQLPTFLICYAVAFISAIMVEAPSIKLMKLFLRGKKDDKPVIQQVMVLLPDANQNTTSSIVPNDSQNSERTSSC